MAFFLTNTEFSKKYGVDKLCCQIDKRNSNISKVNLINYNIESNGLLPFKDSSFDVVTMLASIEHIGPSLLVKLIDEIYRVLVIGGKYIITFPAGWTDKLLWLMGKF
jgi:SAM-dependent methyltransferase